MTRTCGRGRIFVDTAAGRHWHKLTLGHAPTRPVLELANPPSEEA